MRVLVVDPDPDVREVISDLVFDAGVEVLGVASLEGALPALERERLAVLLCHAQILCLHDGLLSRRARRKRPPLRVVAMSGGGLRAPRGEADANLAKPFTRAQLLAVLRADR